jgi:hypothetical protein
VKNVSERPRFCRPCASHFCPHVAPHLYGKAEAARYLKEVERLRREKLVVGPHADDAP